MKYRLLCAIIISSCMSAMEQSSSSSDGTSPILATQEARRLHAANRAAAQEDALKKSVFDQGNLYDAIKRREPKSVAKLLVEIQPKDVNAFFDKYPDLIREEEGTYKKLSSKRNKALAYSSVTGFIFMRSAAHAFITGDGSAETTATIVGSLCLTLEFISQAHHYHEKLNNAQEIVLLLKNKRLRLSNLTKTNTL